MAGVVKRLSADGFGAAATAHIETMHGIPGLERGVGEADRVTGFARSFQAVNQHQLGPRVVLWALRMNQDLDSGLRAVQVRFDREAAEVNRPLPEICRDSRKVRALK